MSLFRKKTPVAPPASAPVAERTVPLMKVMHPEKFTDAPLIADELIAGRTVVMDLTEMEREAGRLLLNFISGVTYALDGSIKRISERAFLVTPDNVAIAPEEAEEALRRHPAASQAASPAAQAKPTPPADPVAAMFSSSVNEEED
ncbi:MAG: cell division protein SepF [Clostridia bacterium]|nr:cell division protein SepF [Clostridia bacterium]